MTSRLDAAGLVALDLEARIDAIEADFPATAAGWRYAAQVLRGEVVACEWVRLACARAWADLEAAEAGRFPFRFEWRAAERVLRAISNFREIKGPRGGRRLKPEPWQCFALGQVFGWVDFEGWRRFRYALWFVPRGNGKTTILAPIALYMGFLDREAGAEVYAAAVTRDQARLVFSTSQAMAQRDKDFRTRFGLEVGANSIFQTSSASVIRPLSRDANSLDGLNVHLAVLDELAAHKTRELHDVLLTATGKRAQPLIFAITTAGANQSGVGYQQWQYAQRILRREIIDERFFAVLYTIDKDDDWLSPESWKKANPNWGVSVQPAAIESLAARAQALASEQNSFKQKHLNIWTNAASGWVPIQKWHDLAEPEMKANDFAGCPCIIGLDLAAKVDLASKIKLFWQDESDGKRHFYVFGNHWLPAAAIMNSANASFAGWAADGWLSAPPGEVIDYEEIKTSILEDRELFDLVDIAFDPWQGLMMARELRDHGIPMIEVRPTVANFSPAMKEIEALIRDGCIHHNGDPVLAWCLSCIQVRMDFKGNIYPRKDAEAGHKIDAAIALIMAMARYLAIEAEGAGNLEMSFL